MQDSIEGKNVIVTGGAGGIGGGLIKGLARRGAKIAALYNRSEPEGELATLASWYKCDLTRKDSVKSTFDEIIKALGGLDALVNVAGTWRGGSAEEVDDEQIDFLIGANFKSVVYTNQAAFEAMKDKGGRIINFGSPEAMEGSPGSPVYASAKAAVQAWTRSAAQSWAGYGITVNSVTPAMHTPPYERIRQSLDEKGRAELDASVAKRIPLGRLGDPEQDCAPLIAFLISDGSRFMTGQILPVDGGLRMLGA